MHLYAGTAESESCFPFRAPMSLCIMLMTHKRAISHALLFLSGVLFPYYDHDTRMVYVAGKGDGNVRFYEIVEEAPWACYLNQFISGSPQRGLGVLPKRGCDTARCEIFRFYKLHATKDLVEPIAMIVPRKSEMFQDDIYPETAAPTPSLTGE